MNQHQAMSKWRLSNNSLFQLTLGLHFALLVLMAVAHRYAQGGGYSPNSFRPVIAIFSGVFVAQVALIGWWAAWSRSSSARRIGALVLLAPLLAAVQSQVFCRVSIVAWFIAGQEDYYLRYLTWVVEFTAFAFHVYAVGMILRSCGFRCGPEKSPPADPWSWHFGFRDVAEWSAVVGLLLAGARWLQEYGWRWEHLLIACEWCSCEYVLHQEFIVLALTITGGLLWFPSRRWGIVAMLVSPLVLAIAGELFRLRWMLKYPDAIHEDYSGKGYFPHSDPELAALQFFAFAVVFGGTMLVVRASGYRLTWQKPWTSPPVAGST
jgi:hypothetical protein